MGTRLAAAGDSARAVALAVERVILVERADHVDFGSADGIAPDELADHAHQLRMHLALRQPAKLRGKLDHPRADHGKVGIFGEAQETVARDGVPRDRGERREE